MNGYYSYPVSYAVSTGCQVLYVVINRCLQADSWRVVSASDDRTIKVIHKIFTVL